MKDELKWEGLLNALLGHKFGIEQEIQAVRIEGKEVVFKASPKAYGKLQAALSNPAILRNSVSHAMPIKSEEESGAAAAASEVPQERGFPTLPQNAREVMDTLVSKKFQELIGVDRQDFQDSRPKIAGWKIGEEAKTQPLQKALQVAQLKEKLAKLDFLRHAFKDMDQLCGIILGDAGIIEADDIDGTNVFASDEVLQVNVHQSKTEAVIYFNWGRILEEASAKPKMYGSTPIISAKTLEQGLYSVNMDSLGYFIPEQLGPLLFHKTSTTHGTVFGTKGLNESEDESVGISPTIFHLLIDHSTSLSDIFGEYLSRIQTSIDYLIKECSKWEIRITGFGTEKDETKIFNSQKDSKNDVKTFINDIRCTGATAVYDAILSSLTDDGSNIILYTDGQNTAGKCVDSSEVASKLAAARDLNPKFSMTSIGYGPYYDEHFFNDVARKNGFYHADIRALDKLEALQGYFLGLNGSKALFEFVHELLQHKLKMQTIKGQVTVIAGVPVGAIVKHGDNEFMFKGPEDDAAAMGATSADQGDSFE